MNDADFKARQKAAIEQLQQLGRQTAPQPEREAPAPKQSGFLDGLPFHFLDRLKTDGDLTLILGILLLLLSEKADKRLLFALVYILL